MPAGGLREDGLRWLRPPSADFFLPQRVLAARFRNRLKQSLAQAQAFPQIPAAVWRQNWVVDVQPVGGGEAALKYLSAYVGRTALGTTASCATNKAGSRSNTRTVARANGAP